MKRIFAIVMTIFLLISVLCIPTSALKISSNDVIRVYGLKRDGTPVILNGYEKFDEGWEATVDYAEKHDFMDENGFDRIAVDFLADWNASSEGVFGKSSWTGFQYSTIYVPSDTRITINLNGHTINRGLKTYENDGEVICINDDADVIINGGKSGDPIIEPDKDPGEVKMGTITGGFSCNGAGGIHMQDNSKLTLNNVNIVGNKVDDDDGAGIAVYDGASLTMNGGCVSDNVSYNSVYGGGVYINDASASFTDVTFENNQGLNRSTHGAAVYVDESTMTMEGCKVVGNGLANTNGDQSYWVACSIIHIDSQSDVNIKETRFLKNGCSIETATGLTTLKYTSVISSKASYLTMEKCTFTDNNQVYLLDSEAAILNVSDSDFSGNKSFAFYGNCAVGFNSAFTNCKFSYNEPMLSLEDTFFFNISNAGLCFTDCDFGKATFNNKRAAQFVDTDALNGVASMFGAGSLARIIVLIALFVSIISICTAVVYKKKNKTSVATDPIAETEDEE